MSKPQLTIEEFRRLPRAIQNVRYKEMTDHDKFLARLEDGSWPLGPPNPNEKPMAETMEELVELINNGFQKLP